MDPEQLRADIPALDRAVYLNTGASSPSPRRVVEAMTDFAEYFEYEVPVDKGVYTVGWEAYEAARETIADFLGVDSREIALTKSTADGDVTATGMFHFDEAGFLRRFTADRYLQDTDTVAP